MLISIWAPYARGTVEVVLGERRVPLAANTRGHWSADVPDLTAGTDYRISVDGGEPRPDPRSASLPGGTHGPSRIVDHDAFAWTDRDWTGLDWPHAVVYELHIGTFTGPGTFEAAIAQLDHLLALGVTAIEVLPIAEFPGARGWGYDGVGLYAPHSRYGGPEGFKQLVDACHTRGLGVILDVVYNHLGPDGNYLGDFGPYFSAKHRTNWGAGINVDGAGSDAVRDFVVDNALMWLRDYHCDGLRLDAVHAIEDESAVHILERLSAEVTGLANVVGRPLTLIAESDLNAPRFVRGRDAGGYGLDSSWADEWHHALHSVLTGETNGYYQDFGGLDALAKALGQAWVYDGQYSVHRDRAHGRAPAGLTGEQFVVCTQNHDQVGNRAAGERLSALTTPGRCRIAAALMLTAPFVPMLFQGEEWAASTPFQYFTDHGDPELARAVSYGRTHEFAYFGWRPEDVPDPQDVETFTRSTLRWDELAEPDHAAMLTWYRSLTALRRSYPALAGGPLDDVRVDFDGAAGWLVVHRAAAGISVAVNLGPEPIAIPVEGDLLLASSAPERADAALVVAPDEVVVLADRR